MYLMSAAWGSLAIVLSLLGGLWGWFAWRRTGWPGLLRGVGLVLLPLGLWLTGTLRLVGFLVDWFAAWATGLVLSPSVLVGSGFVVGSLALLALAQRVVPRARPVAPVAPGTTGTATRSAPGRPAAGRRADPAVGDDDLADIEALLRRRGIE